MAWNVLSYLHPGYGAEVLIAFADVFICQVKIRLFRDGDAGVTQYFAEGVDIHSTHQAAFGKVVAQTMGCYGVFDSGTLKIVLEVSLKVADLNRVAAILCRKEIIAFNITVFELNPAPENPFGFGREEDHAVFAPFCDFGTERDALCGQRNIRDKENGTFTQPHTAIKHQHYHGEVPVFGVIGLIQMVNKVPELVIGKIVLCLSVHFQLLYLLHWVLLEKIVPV